LKYAKDVSMFADSHAVPSTDVGNPQRVEVQQR
jgi:hypothetical protein